MTHLETDEQLAWMQRELTRYTYRPGWKMTITAGHMPTGPAMLVVRYEALDSRDPTRVHQFRAHRSIGPYGPDSDPDKFARELQHRLFDLEQHESREWLRRDGELLDDPHADPSRWQCARCSVTGPARHEGATWTCPDCNARYNS